ncbi:MAG: Type II secretion system protein D precursor [Syntrophorhabdus sp. PtaU1.Bin153]|nr:MAG: Type II secretion system protein D precursor [Syntrophorhabdus sp. PtaU1.Bin153]
MIFHGNRWNAIFAAILGVVIMTLPAHTSYGLSHSTIPAAGTILLAQSTETGSGNGNLEPGSAEKPVEQPVNAAQPVRSPTPSSVQTPMQTPTQPLPSTAQPAAPGPQAQPQVQPQPQPAKPLVTPSPTQPSAITVKPGSESLKPPGPQPRQAPPPQRPVPMGARRSISLNFDDADVYQVVQTIFGDVLRVNYVVDPRVKGRVTFRSVAPIAADQVLPLMEVVLRINGVGIVEDKDLYRIVPLSEVSREPAPVGFGRDPESVPTTGKSIVQLVPILYLQSSEIIKLLTPFLSANAVVIDVPKTNQIIMVDTDASIRRILQLIATLDNEQQKKKQAQVFVYPVQNGKAKNVADLLQQIFLGARPSTSASASTSGQAPSTGTERRPQLPQVPTTAGAQGGPGTSPGGVGGESLVSDITKIFSDDVINSVIVLATPEDYSIIKETIEKIDLLPRQVMIEGLVASVTLTDNLSLGLSWMFKTQFQFGPHTILKGDIGLNTGNLATDNLPSSGFTFVGRAGDEIRAVFNALANQSKAKIIAAPHILVADNRQARIQVGQQVPIVTSETFGSTTVSPQRTIQYKDIGIILKVTPQVNESGLVSLEINQEISGYETIQLFADETNIILNKTEASTNVVVQDGETVVIGGLIREDKSKSRTGIPWLTKIPVLGYLFGDSTDENRRVEIIVLLTPRVIKTQAEARDLTSDYVDRMAKTGKDRVTKEELLKNRPPEHTSNSINQYGPGIQPPEQNP